MVHKFQPVRPAERKHVSRLAIVFSGSPLFTGGAGSGESNIRKWIIENHWLEAIIALPEQMFYNTGIGTLNLNEKQTVDEKNSLARNEFFRFTVTKTSPAHSYEARFSSERSKKFRQCWEIGKGKCKEITHGPEPLATER